MIADDLLANPSSEYSYVFVDIEVFFFQELQVFKQLLREDLFTILQFFQ